MSAPPNTLYYGDNLTILREHIADESADLIYLDPPFNSQRNYNILFRDERGKLSDAQIAAFEDTWKWGEEAERLYRELVADAPARVGAMIGALHTMLGRSPMMAYLVMMAARLVELHRVLKSTGSLYLHCDSTASHYLKILLDAIFGPEQFINEITWKRTTAHGNASQGARHYGRNGDTILFYAKSRAYTWNQPYTAYDESYVAAKYRYIESDTGRRYQLGDLSGPGGAAKGNACYEFLGVVRYWRYAKETMNRLYQEGRIVQPSPGAVPRYKRYLDEMKGQPLQSIWTDIDPLNSQAAERLGYPTQKPVALLERIITASSNPGDVILDPFCGCGTAIAAAQRLGRAWVGIDITHLAINIQKSRLFDAFGLVAGEHYQVIGEPEDLGAARALALQDRYQFQWWALSLIRARPLGEVGDGRRGRKGADRGIDGQITFFDEPSAPPKRALVQVKSGRVTASDVRDLRGTIERERAALGAFITLEPPTREMLAEAVAAGCYHSPGWGQDYPRLQILPVADLLRRAAELRMPPIHGPHKQAPRARAPVAQAELWSD